MNGLTIAGGILLMITSILLIILVLMQDSKQSGNVFTGETDSYLSKNKSRTLEAKLALVTRILLIVLFVLVIAVNLVIRYVK